MAGLREELKEYEAEFKRIHRRPPGKSDIKAVPDIAEKYRIYHDSKRPSTSVKAVADGSSNAKAPASSIAPTTLPTTVEAQNDIFKTPTKPRRSKKASDHVSIATGAVAAVAAATTYITSSPSKLRALSASYATSSPNRPLKSSTIEVISDVAPPRRSPRKLLARSSSTSSGSSLFMTLSKTAGSGEADGSDRDGEKSWERVFAGTTKKDALLKEKDKATLSDAGMTMDDEDLSLLGPSPAKRTADGRKAKGFKSLFPSDPFFLPTRIPPHASTSASIFSSEQSSDASTSASNPPHIPLPIAQPFRHSEKATTRAATENSISSFDHPTLQPLRGVKRALVTPLAFDSDLPVESSRAKRTNDNAKDSAAFDEANGKGKEKESMTSKTKEKVKTGPRASKAKRIRTKGPAEEVVVELNHEGRESAASLRRRNEKEIIILDIGRKRGTGGSSDHGDGDEETSMHGRVLIHPRRPYFSKQQQQQPQQSRRHIQPGESDEEHSGEDTIDGDDMEEDEGTIDGTGTLYYRDQADLLASDNIFVTAPRPQVKTQYDAAEMESDKDESASDDDRNGSRIEEQHIVDCDSIPFSLLSTLSLRSSPIKKTSLLREKDRDFVVAQLLQDPTERLRKKVGLSDLIDEDSLRNERGGADAQIESDDDWASDVEGWKDLGDGEMDGWGDRVLV